jgi:hypothetical protein
MNEKRLTRSFNWSLLSFGICVLALAIRVLSIRADSALLGWLSLAVMVFGIAMGFWAVFILPWRRQP